jgi:hypothetical protein
MSAVSSESVGVVLSQQVSSKSEFSSFWFSSKSLFSSFWFSSKSVFSSFWFSSKSELVHFTLVITEEMKEVSVSE